MSAPTVTGLSVSSGSQWGGTTVIITGTNFVGGVSVLFGATAAASITVNSSTQITAVSPVHAAGLVHITVTTSGGTSATSSADYFTFLAVFPTLPGISWDNTATPEFSTDVFTAQSGKEVRTSNRPTCRWHFELHYEFLRADAKQELQTLVAFFLAQKGSMVPFAFVNPADGLTYTCRFEDDASDFSNFLSLLWEAQSIKIVSLL